MGIAAGQACPAVADSGRDIPCVAAILRPVIDALTRWLHRISVRWREEHAAMAAQARWPGIPHRVWRRHCAYLVYSADAMRYRARR